jgi:hypothetical protein
MGLVRENIGFTRNSSKEAIKTTLFGKFSIGQIITRREYKPTNPVYVIEYIVDSQLPEIELSIMGLGYFYNYNYRNPGDPPEKWFDFLGGYSSSTGDPKDYRSLTEEEIELIKKAIKKKPQEFESKKKDFIWRSSGKPILLESDTFRRGLSPREIKDRLVGFRPGELFTYDKPWAKNKPYKEVYMFVKKAKDPDYNYEGGTPIIACYIGALNQRDGVLSQFLARNKKVLGTANLWQEEKRSLTNEEIEKVKKTFSELPGYLKKITDETGLVPSLNENMEFKRASSEREIKEKLLGWRPGQILVVDSPKHRRVLAFAGITEKLFIPGDEWVIRCLEIGHVGGTPKIAYIHFGFTEDIVLKKKNQLTIPNEEEIFAIQKALKNPDYRKYVQKAEEKIGARLFV